MKILETSFYPEVLSSAKIRDIVKKVYVSKVIHDKLPA